MNLFVAQNSDYFLFYVRVKTTEEGCCCYLVCMLYLLSNLMQRIMSSRSFFIYSYELVELPTYLQNQPFLGLKNKNYHISEVLRATLLSIFHITLHESTIKWKI